MTIPCPPVGRFSSTPEYAPTPRKAARRQPEYTRRGDPKSAAGDPSASRRGVATRRSRPVNRRKLSIVGSRASSPDPGREVAAFQDHQGRAATGNDDPQPLPSPGSRRPPNTAPSSLLPRLAPVRIHLQSDVNGREENNMATPIEEIATERRWAAVISCAALIVLAASLSRAGAQEAKILKTDAQIDGRDPGVRLFVREKMT